MTTDEMEKWLSDLSDIELDRLRDLIRAQYVKRGIAR